MPRSTLASWKDRSARQTIEAFVERVTRPGGPDFVPPEERVAVFDNDGTLWCEKPLPVQADFLLRRVAAQGEQQPALRARQPWKAVAEKDYAWLSGAMTKHYRGDDADLELMATGLLQAYAGSTIDEFEAEAREFLVSARHPQLGRPYLACAYQPMLELLRYLEASGFTNLIASGGGRDFMRPVAWPLYRIPPERVIGSSVTLQYRDGGPLATLIHGAELEIFDDGPAKPVQIWSRTGRRPLLAAGNSNGDIPMLHFCAHPARPSLALLLDHDDAEREYAYREGAEEAQARAARDRWVRVSLKDDWSAMFAPAPAAAA